VDDSGYVPPGSRDDGCTDGLAKPGDDAAQWARSHHIELTYIVDGVDGFRESRTYRRGQAMPRGLSQDIT
jgi:hypothetical protein